MFTLGNYYHPPKFLSRTSLCIVQALRMVFACQADSYCKEFKTKVVSCAELNDGNLKTYEVELEDTVLFPEGGGQPDDRGTINDAQVTRVLRRGAKAIHIVDSPLEEGLEVKVTVDWQRRFDHMQQHSAQHLITAIADDKYQYKTVSWDLGRSRSCIDLDTNKVTSDEMMLIEREANKYIRDQVPVVVHTYQNKDAPELKTVRTRGLPDDHVGPVRIVELKGIEANMCCGTHVENLSHLQAIKLLYTESNRGGTRLFFIAGNRILDYCQKAFDNERSLSKLLSCGADEHVEAVDKLQKSVRSINKVSRCQLREIALLEVEKFKSSLDGRSYICIHREDGDNEYMNTIVSGLMSENVLILVTVGPDKGQGQFLLAGKESTVNELAPKIASLLSGKGGGRKGRFQGKANNIKARNEAGKLLQEYFKAS